MFASKEKFDAFEYIESKQYSELTVVAIKNIGSWLNQMQNKCSLLRAGNSRLVFLTPGDILNTDIAKGVEADMFTKYICDKNAGSYIPYYTDPTTTKSDTRIVCIEFDNGIVKRLIDLGVKVYIIERDPKIETVDGVILGKEGIPYIRIPTNVEPFKTFDKFYSTFASLYQTEKESTTVKFINNKYIELLYRAFGFAGRVFVIKTMADYSELYSSSDRLPDGVVIYIPQNQEWIMDSIKESVDYGEYGKMRAVDDSLTTFAEIEDTATTMINFHNSKTLKIMYFKIDGKTTEPYVSNTKFVPLPDKCKLEANNLFVIPEGYRQKIPFDSLDGVIVFTEYKVRRYDCLTPLAKRDHPKWDSYDEKVKEYLLSQYHLPKDIHGNYVNYENLKAHAISFLSFKTRPIKRDSLQYRHVERKKGQKYEY